MKQSRFKIRSDRVQALQGYLRRQGWLAPGEKLGEVYPPGEGNMNYVLRIVGERRSFIIKQSRPYVVKYPQVEAPEDRILVEAAFYEKAATVALLHQRLPGLLGLDSLNRVMALEDLGKVADYSYLYEESKTLEISDALQLVGFLTTLHGSFYREEPKEIFRNREMRALNHHHIFVYPFESNGLNLDELQPGLQKVANRIRANPELVSRVRQVGEAYLSDGPCLLHGDFYPQSWMKTQQGPKVIDPEFCFYGPPEFDLAVFIAHLKLCRQPDELVERILRTYKPPRPLDRQLMDLLVGIEIMRRLIGLAQLPLSMSLGQKEGLLDCAQKLIDPGG